MRSLTATFRLVSLLHRFYRLQLGPIMALGDLSRIERGFAEAAIDPTLWVRALDVATEETRSFGATLLPLSGLAIPSVPVTESAAEASEHYFRDGWHRRDQRYAGLRALVHKGVIDDGDCTDLEGINRHPYYQEFLAPHGLRWFAGIKLACGDELWCLSIQRKIEQGPFPKEDKARLASLSASLSASAALARALACSTVEGALDAFEMSKTAVALVNRHGEIYRINRAAEDLLKGDIRISARKIVTHDHAASAALDRAIHQLMWRTDTAALAVPVLLSRLHGRPIVAYPAKLSAISSNALARCQAVVVLVDPDERRAGPEQLLRSGFSLTAAEANLASRLATGASLEDIANKLEIAKQTSRTHLKRIFAKLGVARQSELVALLSTFSRFGPRGERSDK